MQYWVLFALQTVTIAAVTSWITVYLSKRQFRYQQGWERKFKCYEDILERLNDILLIGSDLIASEENPNHFGFFSDDDVLPRTRAFMQNIAKAYTVWSLLISIEATKAIEEMSIKLRETPTSMNKSDLVKFNIIVENALIKVHNAARKDLWGYGIGYYKKRWILSQRSGLIDRVTYTQIHNESKDN